MSSPFPPFGSQDLNDDDGQVIDSFLIETDTPPNPADAIQPIVIPKIVEPTPTTRLLTGYMNVTATSLTSPWMVLPADKNRKSLTLSVFSQAASPAALVEYVSMADENGKVLTSAAMNLRHGKDPYVIEHTGPVFIQGSPTLTAAMEVTWVAVTL